MECSLENALAYFVTICTVRREYLFADDRQPLALHPYGKIAEHSWHQIPEHFPHVSLDRIIVMPNHLHGILWFPTTERDPRARESFGQPQPGTLATVMRSYKATVTHEINYHRRERGLPVWQRKFHDHRIRDEAELQQIRRYIEENPTRWTIDRHLPDDYPNFLSR